MDRERHEKVLALATMDQLELPGGIGFTSRGLVLPDRLTDEVVAEAAGKILGATEHLLRAQESMLIALADLMARAPNHRVEIQRRAMEIGYSPGALRNALLVCSRIELSCRHDNLSWTHHQEIGLRFQDKREIKRWLAKAEKNQWSCRRLREEIVDAKLKKAKKDQGEIEDPDRHGYEFVQDLTHLNNWAKSNAKGVDQWEIRRCRGLLDKYSYVIDFVDALRARAGVDVGPTPGGKESLQKSRRAS